MKSRNKDGDRKREENEGTQEKKNEALLALLENIFHYRHMFRKRRKAGKEGGGKGELRRGRTLCPYNTTQAREKTPTKRKS